MLRLFAGRAAAEMERSRAEDALATTEARLSDAIESIPDGFVLYDAEDRLITCNQAYRDLYKGVAELIRPGVSFEELVRAMVERGTVDIPPDRREAWIDNRIVRHQAPTDSFENKLSNDRWVLVIERRTREGGTVGIRTDITDIKNAEIALRESERKYRGIFDGAQVGLARFNLINGRTLEANDHFVRMMRYDSRDDFCQHFGGPGIYVDPERWGDLLRLGRETPVVEDFTTAFYRKDGTVAWLNLNLSFDWDENRAEVVAADVTERREALEALRLAKEEAELANRAKSDFLANMSHELRTPLNAVIGFAEMMIGEIFGPHGSPKYNEYVTDIKLSADHLLKIIDDILDISKIETGHLDVEMQVLAVDEIIASCLSLIRHRARQSDVRLISEVQPGLTLFADPRLLQQILLNLLTNAVKFTPRGGSVTISAGQGPDGAPRIAVSDTGIGIAAADIDRVLEPFVRLESAFCANVEGTGLGLPLVKSLVELHGGSLEIESRPDTGTTVSVLFPDPGIIHDSGLDLCSSNGQREQRHGERAF